MKLLLPVIVMMFAQLLAAQPRAQNAPADVEVQGADILRTCREIHRAPQAQEPNALANAQGGITFNCRLVNANGSTLAQVSPEEVCERLTGSREWYRGAGTQVFCTADGEKTRAVAVPCPQPTDEQIVAEDVSRACQKVHRTGNATAEPLRMSINGPEFNCRLSNSAGFTIAGVSPEQVCEQKTGRRQWCFTETTSYCRGSDYVEPVNPNPGKDSLLIPSPNTGPEQKPGPEAPKPVGEEGNVEIPQQEAIEFCKPKSPGGDVVVRITGYEKHEPGTAALMKPLVTCDSSAGVPPEQLCPSIVGSASWYISADGFSKKNGVLWPNWIAVCRGTGPRERIGHADIIRVCLQRGWKGGNNGITAQREPVCHNMKGGGLQAITVEDICNTLYGTSAWEVKGITHWCLP
jgi:hypothetical protein